MGGQHDFRMDDATLVGVVVGHAALLVCQLLTASVDSGSYSGLANVALDDLNVTIKNVMESASYNIDGLR